MRIHHPFLNGIIAAKRYRWTHECVIIIIFRSYPMASIFLPFFRGQETSFFRLFFARNSGFDHNILWSKPTFSPSNHNTSSELSRQHGPSLANYCQTTDFLFYVCGNMSTVFLGFRDMWKHINYLVWLYNTLFSAFSNTYLNFEQAGYNDHAHSNS